MRYIPCLLSVEERGVLVCSLWVGYVFLFFCLGWTVSFDISFFINSPADLVDLAFDLEGSWL